MKHTKCFVFQDLNYLDYFIENVNIFYVDQNYKARNYNY